MSRLGEHGLGFGRPGSVIAQVSALFDVDAVAARIARDHHPDRERLRGVMRMMEGTAPGLVTGPVVAILGSAEGEVRFVDGRHRFWAVAEGGGRQVRMWTTRLMLRAAREFGLLGKDCGTVGQ